MKEVASLGKKEGPDNLFSPVRIDLQCVLFFKTSPAIDPVDFVHRICVEIVSKPGIRRMRYVNRLTPVTMTEKATEKGITELGKTVLGRHFHLAGDERSGEADIEPDYSVRPILPREYISGDRENSDNDTPRYIVLSVDILDPEITGDCDPV